MNTPVPDQKVIDKLNQEAWNKKASDTMRSGLLSDEAIGLSRSINYRKGLAEGLRTYGYALFRHSQFSEAKEFLDKSMEIFLETGNEGGQADVNETRGIMARINNEYQSSLQYLFTAFQLRKSNNESDGRAHVLYQLGITCHELNLTSRALDFFLQSIDASASSDQDAFVSDCLQQIGIVLLEMQRPEEALAYFQKRLAMEERGTNHKNVASCLDKIGQSLFMMKKFDDANDYFLRSNKISMAIPDHIGTADTLFHLAETAMALSLPELSNEYASQCYDIRKSIGEHQGLAEVLLLLAELNDKQKPVLLKNALEQSNAVGSIELCGNSHHQLFHYYKGQKIFDRALEHLEQYSQYMQEIQTRRLKETNESLKWIHEAEMNLKASEIDQLQNVRLAGLHEESETQKKAIAIADELNAAQKKLLQREKMAFIGELTAGFAQEIQQTLALINNLSEHSEVELDHLYIEIKNRNQAEMLKIIPEIKNNLKKIHFQSKREEVTLKSMLRHIQLSDGKKEMTDINKLVDDYLRISYQGMRLRDIAFYAELDIHFDQKAGSLHVVTSDIGSILFTILNNAFYSVNEKRKVSGTDYEPRVAIKTMKLDGQIKIFIKDNGVGIPETLREKIFQPFFFGEEVAFSGLSSCYDIAKAHGGDILLNILSVEKTGQMPGGTEFVIVFPN